ncbi:hypothetical protein FACS189435_1690 [Bacteroidia bacterium]|nr:hypothetical protein FACS189435_1690 [Bacteroidia bacterium]
MKEQKIVNLIEGCANALKEEGYSESNIARHRKFWKKVREYMEEHSIINYSADVGDQFLNAMEEYHTLFQADIPP